MVRRVTWKIVCAGVQADQSIESKYAAVAARSQLDSKFSPKERVICMIESRTNSAQSARYGADKNGHGTMHDTLAYMDSLEWSNICQLHFLQSLEEAPTQQD